MTFEPALGATLLDRRRCRFVVWAPRASQVSVRVETPQPRTVPMAPQPDGYFEAIVDGVEPNARYRYLVNGTTARPDPASRFQPDGVHGPSQLVPPTFAWHDQSWSGLPLERYVIYELHVGTCTPEGTFAAIMPILDELKDLGVTAIELMPVAQFPGGRNWGYDGASPFAVQHTYGGPDGFKRLVDACHQRGLAVVLDVVYNHLGPEGNYLAEYGPYFTDRYRTPWGWAVNFDGPDSDHVRRYFIENALYWIVDCHLDALRLDALHAVFDCSARPFLEELATTVHEQAQRLRRPVWVIGESDLNDPRLLRPPALGGYGLDAQWNDDFHHALHTLLTGERAGYYQDFGRIDQLARAYRDGYVYTGQYAAFRRRRHGASSADRPAHQFVVFTQNHDQVGNRPLGERLSQLVSYEPLKLAAGALLLSPYVPLLFMGEEYGEPAPFQYFVSHTDPPLIEAVRKGRRQECAAFAWQGEPPPFCFGLPSDQDEAKRSSGGEPPDPQDEATFRRCILTRALQRQGRHRALRDWYRELLRVRRGEPVLALLSNTSLDVVSHETERVILVHRWHRTQQALIVLHFGDGSRSVSLAVPEGAWQKRLDSAEVRWQGPGATAPNTLHSHGTATITVAAHSCVLYVRN